MSLLQEMQETHGRLLKEAISYAEQRGLEGAYIELTIVKDKSKPVEEVGNSHVFTKQLKGETK